MALSNINLIILIRISGGKNDGVSFVLSIIIFSFVELRLVVINKNINTINLPLSIEPLLVTVPSIPLATSSSETKNALNLARSTIIFSGSGSLLLDECIT